MKNRIPLSILLLIVCVSCVYRPGLREVIQATQLPAYEGVHSYDLSLLKKVSVLYEDTSEQVNFYSGTNFNQAANTYFLGGANDHLHSVYFDKDKEVLLSNFREFLFQELARAPFHSKIDSIKVVLQRQELLIPYFDGNQVIEYRNRAVRTQYHTIGPSRGMIRARYECYHNGYLTENEKYIRQTIPAITESYHNGGRSEIVRRHIAEGYDLMNELLELLSKEIVAELGSVLLS